MESVGKNNKKNICSKKDIWCFPACHRRTKNIQINLDPPADWPSQHYKAVWYSESLEQQGCLSHLWIHGGRPSQRDILGYPQRCPYQVYCLSVSKSFEVPPYWCYNPSWFKAVKYFGQLKLFNQALWFRARSLPALKAWKQSDSHWGSGNTVVQGARGPPGLQMLLHPGWHLEFRLHNLLDSVRKAPFRGQFHLGPNLENMFIYWIPIIVRHKIHRIRCF